MTDGEIHAYGLLVSGSLLLLWRGRRKFSRRNINGVEQFPSHGNMVVTKAWETVLFGAGVTLLGGSVFSLLLNEQQVLMPFVILIGIAYQFRK